MKVLTIKNNFDFIFGARVNYISIIKAGDAPNNANSKKDEKIYKIPGGYLLSMIKLAKN